MIPKHIKEIMWTQGEMEILRIHYGGFGWAKKTARALPSRTIRAIHTMAFRERRAGRL